MSSTRRRARLETAAMLMAVFIAGGLGGAALERRARGAEAVERRGDFVRSSGSIPGFYEALDLSADQRAEIERILATARPETDSLLRTALPRLRALTRSTRAAIADVLTDDQRADLEESFRNRRERFRDSPRGRRSDRHERSTGREDPSD